MQEIFCLGIDDESIMNMLEVCPNIKELSNDEIKEKIEILTYLECNDRQKKNIIESNPYYLDRMTSDVLKLINKLKEYGFTCLNILFDSNPYIFNLDAFEVENYVNNRINKKEELEDIVDELSSSPYLFDEM